MSESRPILTLHAPAKVNLALAVAPPEREPGPRQGWHRIASWFAPISLADTLTLTRLDDESLSAYSIDWARTGSALGAAPMATVIDWPITRDLAVRAHLLLEREVGRPLPLRLRLEKRIPAGGGLGGGSSDAAAMLRGVNDLYTLGIPAERLRELSRELGSDVAFFLGDPGAPAPALVAGFGDRIEPAPGVVAETGAPTLVLIFPDFGCPTPAVYRAFDSIPPEALRPSPDFAEREAAAKTLAQRATLDPIGAESLFNDLAIAAETVAPALRELRAAVRRRAGAEPHVTGSGSTLFIVARDAAHAEALRHDLAALGVVTVITRVG